LCRVGGLIPTRSVGRHSARRCVPPGALRRGANPARTCSKPINHARAHAGLGALVTRLSLMDSSSSEHEQSQTLAPFTAARERTFYERLLVAVEPRAQQDALHEVRSGHRVTFAALLRRVDEAAQRLASAGVREDDAVGIYMERGIAFEVCRFACSKLGALFLPLAPDYPDARLAGIVTDAGAAIVVTEALTAPTFLRLAAVAVRALAIDDGNGPADSHKPRTAWVASPSRGGVLLTSSGSTGRSKLILRRQCSFSHRFEWTDATLPFGADEQCVQKSHMSTTHSLYELMLPLMSGVTVHILPDRTPATTRTRVFAARL
jgi:non-ribosomal peptide synthetase component F